MVQIAMVVFGLVTGLACRTWKQALAIVVAVFVVGLAVQTPSVASEGHLHTAVDVVSYSLIQAVSLVIGLAIASALVRRRERRSVTA